MVTTIQISEGTKMILSKLKQGKETYEDVIVRIVGKSNNNNELLKKGYIALKDSVELDDWKNTDLDW
jgi:predicted CopG family antitoxin